MAWYHQLTARLLKFFPGLQEKITLGAAGSLPVELPAQPWTPLEKDPFEARLMLVTTGGVHTPEQTPFDMSDSRGDTSYRWIPRDQEQFKITHDYYDHSDADEDVNCLFPLPLARRLAAADLTGPLVKLHPSFMGHVEDPLVPELVEKRLPELWEELEDRPDLIVLSPG